MLKLEQSYVLFSTKREHIYTKSKNSGLPLCRPFKILNTKNPL